MGNGFYTSRYHPGESLQEGFPIIFQMNPQAREEHDFTFTTDSRVLILNKQAVRVVPESVSLPSVVNVFEVLAKRGSFPMATSMATNHALMERIRRKTQAHYFETFRQDVRKALALLWNWIRRSAYLNHDEDYICIEWFKCCISASYPGLFLEYLARAQVSSKKPDHNVLVWDVLSRPHWARHPEFLKRAAQRGEFDKNWPALIEIFKSEEWANKGWGVLLDILNTAVFLNLKQHKKHGRGCSCNNCTVFSAPFFSNLLTKTALKKEDSFYMAFIEQEIVPADFLFDSVLPHNLDHWAEHPKIFYFILEKYSGDEKIEAKVYPFLEKSEDLLVGFFTHGEFSEFKQRKFKAIIQNNPNSSILKKLSAILFKTQNRLFLVNNARGEIFANLWLENRKLLEEMIESKEFNRELATNIFGTIPPLSQFPELVAQMIRARNADREIAEHVLSKAEYIQHPWLIEMYIRAGGNLRVLDKHVLSTGIWAGNGELLGLLATGRSGGPTAAELKKAFIEAKKTLLPPSDCERLLL